MEELVRRKVDVILAAGQEVVPYELVASAQHCGDIAARLKRVSVHAQIPFQFGN
jgi:hypothetical protein